MKLGLVVFCNDSGLGAQTRRLCYMLKPDVLLAIDSTPFSKNKSQHFEWYDNFTGYRVSGFPKNNEIKTFLKDLTHVVVCENPLNFYLLDEAKRMGVKVYIQSNYEFCDHLDKELTLPHKFLMPSHWKVAEMKAKFGDDKVMYLPPPIDSGEFSRARNVNMGRSGQRPRLLHIVGTLAAHDRNGTLDLIEALKLTNYDFELTIRSQHDLPGEYKTDDYRVTYAIGNEDEVQDMYIDYDALVLPRRYGGLSLTCNEAMMAGLPVIMTDISPNNELLPKNWLVPAKTEESFFTRTNIDIYKTSPFALAKTIELMLESKLAEQKTIALDIAYNEFSTTMLKPKYEDLWSQ